MYPCKEHFNDEHRNKCLKKETFKKRAENQVVHYLGKNSKNINTTWKI